MSQVRRQVYRYTEDTWCWCKQQYGIRLVSVQSSR